MVTKQLAQALVEEMINQHDPSWPNTPRIVILEDQTIEKEWGWVFFYQSSEYLDSRDPSALLAGNAPYLFNRHTGEYHILGTAYPVEHYITEYEASLNSST